MKKEIIPASDFEVSVILNQIPKDLPRFTMPQTEQEKEWKWAREKLKTENEKLREALDELENFLKNSDVKDELDSVFLTEGKYCMLRPFQFIDMGGLKAIYTLIQRL